MIFMRMLECPGRGVWLGGNAIPSLRGGSDQSPGDGASAFETMKMAIIAKSSSQLSSVGTEAWSRAFLIRSFEERLLQLFSQGKLFGTVHTCIGQEFTGIAV